MQTRIVGIQFSLILASLLRSEPASAFHRPTHEALTLYAIANSELATGDLITGTLPEFWVGLDQQLDGHTATYWMTEGARREDGVLLGDFSPRPVTHFHDPTSSWGSAGLFHAFESSVQWQQTEGPEFIHQWPQARDLYR